jgi:two-component system, NtrC family, sensor kinase
MRRPGKARGKSAKTRRRKALRPRRAAKETDVEQLARELAEAREREAATAEVLKVISSSPGELQSVFEAMLKNATRICEAKFANLFLYEDDSFRIAAHQNAPPAYAERWRKNPVHVVGVKPRNPNPLDRLATTKSIVNITDLMAEPGYVDRDPRFVALVESAGARTHLLVPMLKEGGLVGGIAIYRQEVRPFTDKQTRLLENFAAQAVIAIENTRLLNELRQRTGDLSEALDRQTATSEVLKVISSSPGELETVFQTLLENATRICEAAFGSMLQREGDVFRRVALHNAPPAFAQFHNHSPTIQWREVSDLKRVVVTKQVIHVADTAAEHLDAPIAKYAGARTLLLVPMLKDKDLIGVIGIYRQEVRLFTDKQIDLVKNFAAQAVIAIENARLLNELRESLQQQTATADVLKVISSSPGQLEPVFRAMLESAVQICSAKFGNLWLYEGDTFRIAATHGAPPAYAEARRSEPAIHFSAVNPLGRLVATRQVQHITDFKLEQSYIDREAGPVIMVEAAGARTVLLVPMLKENQLIGVVAVYRQEVRPFSDKQIELVKSFAAQAVIAIENTRLLSELRESLQQQTATADVLKVISSSPGDLGPVFEAMLEKATSICGAKFGTLFLSEGDCARAVAQFRAPPAYAQVLQREPIITLGEGALGRAARTKQAVQIADVRHDPAYVKDPRRLAILELAGARTMLNVPMLKNNEVVGQLAIYRQEVLPFTDKQIEVVKNFAAQAVIAIENTRLLHELRQRTSDLSEALEQQTATSEVLHAISSSPGELEPVFEAMLANAVRICGAKFGNLWLREGGAFRIGATHGAPQAYADFVRSQQLFQTDPRIGLGIIVTTKQPFQTEDVAAVPTLGDKTRLALIELAGARTLIGVPMLKDDEVIGAIGIYRQEVRPFTDKQVELLKNFAAQAVIAIENTRLLNELRESLQQQTATSEVLKIISRSTFDLQVVLQTLVDAAARLCAADQAVIMRPGKHEHSFYPVASHGYSSESNDYISTLTFTPGREGVVGRVLLERKPVQIADVLSDPDFRFHEVQRRGGFRTLLGLPLLREGNPIGILAVSRSTVHPFDDKHIELLTSFADQAVIAIENVRLFESVEARTRELAKSLEDLRATQDRLVQTQKLASLGQLTAGIAHEIKNPLNFVNNFSGISAELIDELQDTLQGSFDEKARAEIKELTDTLKGNLDKIVQHGKRADAIVKNMLLHSREGSGEHRLVDINALVEESLNLAYHGARAEKRGFDIALERSFDPAAGQADVFPQDIGRVLLNLISNGFYAATKRKATAGDSYKPTLLASTRNLGDRVEIRVRDNGTGIPPEVKEKIFNPFFTTKPAGEGTGLGLSISHDVIVKQHGGSIDVETKPGAFSEFIIVLPRAGAPLVKSGEAS